ncbi:hypothetical protein SO802_032875 [Lithocarpus litseifolius]|uniref:Uncharacterized protein n=1 Tax=Lithocarpus litseifolius TaxID=425828 RepID=A0AAW2BER1_9ROSI
MEPSYSVKSVSESVGVGRSASAESEKTTELSPVEVGRLSGRLENLGEQLIQNTTVSLDAKSKESVTNVDDKPLDTDRALSVDYLDSNLNSSKFVTWIEESPCFLEYALSAHVIPSCQC